jgi:hypothetical protein
MVLMARKRKTSKVSKATPWGYYLESLVSSRHYDNLTQLSDDLRTVGRGCTPQMISKYKSGIAPLWFIADSIEVLDLNEAETNKYVGLWLDTLPPNERTVHQRMAALLLKGSDNAAITPENREQARKFVEEIEESERQRGEGQNGAGNP